MATTAKDVLWFIPNLIGYFRVLCSLLSFALLLRKERFSLALTLYLLNFAGDLVDGYAARRYQQTSQFGGVLDMITDRCSTLGLLFCIAVRTSDLLAQGVCLSLVLLDISSHWCQMYSTLLSPLSQHHHKSDEGNEGRHFLVRWFYKYYWFFGYLCVGSEFLYMCWIGILHLEEEGESPEPVWGIFTFSWVRTLSYLCWPACIMKQAVNVSQLLSACHTIAEYDAKQKNK